MKSIYVCVKTSELKDAPGGLKGKCADCGSEIWHKPYAPDHIKKVCNDCAEIFIQESLDEDRLIGFLPGSLAPRKYSS